MSTVDGAALVRPLLDLPGVRAAVDEARQACDRVRGHSAVRNRLEPCRAEAQVWAAWASARLAGVDLPVELVREAAGGGPVPGDAAGLVLAGALRATALTERLAADGAAGLGTLPRAVAQLHLAAAAGLEPEADLGRPTDAVASRARLEPLTGLLASRAPAAVVAALLDAELSTAGLFRSGNDVVARAAARSAQIGLGLDPSGVVVTEMGALAEPDGRRAALEAYRGGSPEAVGAWLVGWARTVVHGAEHGMLIADSVAMGRPLTL